MSLARGEGAQMTAAAAVIIPGRGSQPWLGWTPGLIPSPVCLGLWAVGSCSKEGGPRQVVCGEVYRRLGAPWGFQVVLSGCVYGGLPVSI